MPPPSSIPPSAPFEYLVHHPTIIRSVASYNLLFNPGTFFAEEWLNFLWAEYTKTINNADGQYPSFQAYLFQAPLPVSNMKKFILGDTWMTDEDLQEYGGKKEYDLQNQWDPLRLFIGSMWTAGFAQEDTELSFTSYMNNSSHKANWATPFLIDTVRHGTNSVNPDAASSFEKEAGGTGKNTILRLLEFTTMSPYESFGGSKLNGYQNLLNFKLAMWNHVKTYIPDWANTAKFAGTFISAYDINSLAFSSWAKSGAALAPSEDVVGGVNIGFKERIRIKVRAPKDNYLDESSAMVAQNQSNHTLSTLKAKIQQAIGNETEFFDFVSQWHSPSTDSSLTPTIKTERPNIYVNYDLHVSNDYVKEYALPDYNIHAMYNSVKNQPLEAIPGIYRDLITVFGGLESEMFTTETGEMSYIPKWTDLALSINNNTKSYGLTQKGNWYEFLLDPISYFKNRDIIILNQAFDALKASKNLRSIYPAYAELKIPIHRHKFQESVLPTLFRGATTLGYTPHPENTQGVEPSWHSLEYALMKRVLESHQNDGSAVGRTMNLGFVGAPSTWIGGEPTPKDGYRQSHWPELEQTLVDIPKNAGDLTGSVHAPFNGPIQNDWTFTILKDLAGGHSSGIWNKNNRVRTLNFFRFLTNLRMFGAATYNWPGGPQADDENPVFIWIEGEAARYSSLNTLPYRGSAYTTFFAAYAPDDLYTKQWSFVNNSAGGPAYSFLPNNFEYVQQFLINQFDKIVSKTRTVKEVMLDGKTAHSEIIGFVIKKTTKTANDSYGAVKNIYVMTQEDAFEYIDTQLKLDKNYYYDIYALQLIIGTRYMYTNIEETFPPSRDELVVHTESVPDIRIIEKLYHSFNNVVIKDYPPLPPEVEPIPFREQSRIMFNIRVGAGEEDELPIYIKEEDLNIIQNEYVSQYGDNAPASAIEGVKAGQKIKFKFDDRLLKYEVFRLNSKPTSISNFANSDLYALLDFSPDASGGFSDTIEFNRKYYYIFRTIDAYGHLSNPTPIYEIEYVEDNGSIYLSSEIFEFEAPTPTIRKLMRKLFYLRPAFQQSILNEYESLLHGWAPGEALAWKPGVTPSQFTGPSAVWQAPEGVDFVVGISPGGRLFEDYKGKPNKTFEQDVRASIGHEFKVRLTSKSTGRKLDLNLSFKHEHVTTPEELYLRTKTPPPEPVDFPLVMTEETEGPKGDESPSVSGEVVLEECDD